MTRGGNGQPREHARVRTGLVRDRVRPGLLDLVVDPLLEVVLLLLEHLQLLAETDDRVTGRLLRVLATADEVAHPAGHRGQLAYVVRGGVRGGLVSVKGDTQRTLNAPQRGLGRAQES
jgi:hypothetical protein